MNKTIKNYLLLIVVSFLTLVITFYILTWYKQYNDNLIATPVITKVLREVKEQDLDSFLMERDFVILYMCTTSELKCRNFEEDLEKYIKEENLESDLYYFNLGIDKGKNSLINRIYNKYKHEDLLKKVNNYPSFMVFSNGKIIDVLSFKQTKDISLNEAKDFLMEYRTN